MPTFKFDTNEPIIVYGKRINEVVTIVNDLPQKSYVDGLLGLKSVIRLGIKIDFHRGLIEI